MPSTQEREEEIYYEMLADHEEYKNIKRLVFKASSLAHTLISFAWKYPYVKEHSQFKEKVKLLKDTPTFPAFTDQELPIHFVSVFNENDDFVGVIEWNYHRNKKGKINKLYIREIVVNNNKREQGYGTAIINKLINEYAGSLERVELMVEDSSMAPRLFWESLGFKKDKSDDLRYVKYL